MLPSESLLIFGASARAAAFSALRAGLRPWCCDLFADADLRCRCQVMRLTGRYPATFAEVARIDVPGPWMYTGGLENHPHLVRRIARTRRLWGNDDFALRRARDPQVLAQAARSAGLPIPATGKSRPGRWLIKPLTGAGGIGIRFWDGSTPVDPSRVYVQEFIDGPSASVVYVAAERRCRLLGMTRQLVGESWLHAPPFRYCGSIGPVDPGHALTSKLERLGEFFAAQVGVQGLFGIDGIWRDGEFWPVEINPRYPASVEVLEYATGLPALHLHRLAFEQTDALFAEHLPDRKGAVVGKAILYARQDVVFPREGPWTSDLDPRRRMDQMPCFADLPQAGEEIKAGRPVLTLFARVNDAAGCVEALRQLAAEISGQLEGEK